MSVVPRNINTAQQPPMTIPLRHFLVALGFLLLGGMVGLASAIDRISGLPALAHVHLLLAGWVCVTIMGAMTQFVPVWSGVVLHSRRLAALQLWLVGSGLAGLALGLVTGWVALLVPFGTLMLLGFWVFVYNVGRTLLAVDTYDVTERHFTLALAYFAVLPILGVVLAVDLVWPVLDGLPLPVDRTGVVGAHATLAVFGAILTTVFGALYQLATMFTQTELHGIDHWLQRVEEVAFPLGVVGLATARLLGVEGLGTVGGLLIAASVGAYSLILARRLWETQVEWTPTLSRYAVLAGAMAAWALLAVPAWLQTPLGPAARFGAPGTVHLLSVGVLGFVVLGTLYHVVPFIVWVHRYSDLLGYEPVPMIDDIYSTRVARLDFLAFVGGGLLLVVADGLQAPTVVAAVGGLGVLCGSLLFTSNVLVVIREHSPHSLPGVLGVPGATETGTDDTAGDARDS